MASPTEPAMPVEYLTTARLSEKGQITLPKAYRDAVALDTAPERTTSGSADVPRPLRPDCHDLCSPWGPGAGSLGDASRGSGAGHRTPLSAAHQTRTHPHT